MAKGRITIKVKPDGTIEALVAGVPGRKCLDFVSLIEQLTGAATIASERTTEYDVAVTHDLPAPHAVPSKA